MSDTEFKNELKNYISDLLIGKQVVKTEFYINLQPGLISYGGHFTLADNESIPLDIRQKGKSSNRAFADKVKLFHKQSTNRGLNKWNKALFTVDNKGLMEIDFIWDEVWEQEEINSYDQQTESARQKWYWEEK